MDTPAKQLIAYIEEWWGDELNDALVERVRKAPASHLESFYAGLPFKPGLHPELCDDFPVPSLAPGGLRPVVPFSDLTAIRILLYSDSILLGADFLAPMHEMVISTHVNVSDQELAAGAAYRFADLALLKPLIERDLVYFTNITALPYQYEHHVRGNRHGSREWRRTKIEDAVSLRRVTQEAIDTRSDLLHKVETLFTARKATPVAYDALDAAAISQWRRQSPDARSERVGTLARVLSPDVRIGTKDLVRLRVNEELFSEWRHALGSALSSVATREGTVEDASAAREIVGVELDRATIALRRSIARTSALKRLTSGVRAFALGAFVTGGGLVADDSALWPKVLMATGGGLAAGMVEALRPSDKLKEAKLIERLVLDFQASPT